MTPRTAGAVLRGCVRLGTCVGALAAGAAVLLFLPVRPLVAQPTAARAAAAGSARSPVPFHPTFQVSEPGRPVPAIEPARVVGEVLAGAYAGIGGYVLGNWAGGMLATMLPSTSDGTRDRIAMVSGILGAGIATAASVSAIGNIGDQTGSYPAALAGTAGGVAVGLLLNQILYGHARLPSEGESSRVRWIEASLEAMLPAIGATIAFNSTRRFK